MKRTAGGLEPPGGSRWAAEGDRCGGRSFRARTWRTSLSDDTAVDAVLPAGSVVCLLGLEAWHQGERRTSVCEVHTDPAPLAMGLGVRVGGPEAPGGRSLVGTEEGIRAGYPTVRKRLKADDGRAECRREGSVTRTFAYRRPAWVCATRGCWTRASGGTTKFIS
jgi:hypothetical protein